VHVTDAFEAQEQTAELIFPGKDAFDSPELWSKVVFEGVAGI
jgi:hypothetical protein